MNLAKRAIAFALASVFTFGTAAFAENSVNITQRDSYIDEEGNGNLRFLTEVKLDEGKTVEKFGTWVVPKSIFNGWDNSNVLTVQNTKAEDTADLEANGGFTTDIMGIPKNLLSEEFYAKSFVVYKENAQSVWLQAPLASDNVTRSEQQKEDNAGNEAAMYVPTYYGEKDTTTDIEDIDRQNANVYVAQSTFKKVFENTDKYLYRVGNDNNVALSSLFNVTSGTPESVTVDVTNIAGTASGKHTSNATWNNGTIKFSGTGVVEVKIKDSRDSQYNCSLFLEVVDGKNATSAQSATNNNVVLLNNVSGGLSVTGGHTLYGNGFEVKDTRTHSTATSSAGYVTIVNGIVDNVQFIGYEPTAQSFNNNTAGYSPAVRFDGPGEIYNSYISGGRYACYVNGNAYFKNTHFDGGALGNLYIPSVSEVTLENCVTSTSTRGGLKGIGVHISNASAKLNLKGTFEQHNWVKQSDVPSIASSYVGSLYSDSKYYYTSNGAKYVNMGIAFITETASGTDITLEEAQAAVTDTTGNSYSYILNTVAGKSGVVYTSLASMANAELLSDPSFEPDQYYTLPNAAFDYTTKNYKAKTEGDNNYCYYSDGKVNISFDKTNADTTFDWDPMILTAEKDSNTLSYTVSMDGTDYTNKIISFGDDGDHTVVYTYTDPYNYDKDGNPYSATYTKTVKISVTKVIPEAIVYHPEFSYAGSWSSYTAKQVLAGNDTYIMPDATGTSATIGSTTVSGQTIYYPIVTVDGKNSSGGSYSSGKIYCFAPAFSAINIKDLNKDTGATLYTYNSSTQTWPHGISATAGPGNSAYYGPASTRDPYGAATGTAYEKYAYNSSNGGLCFTSNEIERDITANTKTVKFHYVGNDGATYYYYIQYKYSAVTHKSSGGGACVAEGTMITLASGELKAIEDLTKDDKVMAFNHETGLYEATPVFMLVTHGRDMYNIMNLSFSDGSLLRIIESHGLFDLDLKQYVDITEDNYTEFIGHRFAKYAGGQTTEAVTLVSAYITTEETEMMAAFTDSNLNAITEGLISYDTKLFGTYNYFNYDENMKYVTADMQKDIKEYGLYTYNDWSKYLDKATYDAFNFKYFKVSIAKGLVTEEELIGYIDWLSNLAAEGGLLFINNK